MRELLAAYRDHEDLISVGAYRRGGNRTVDAAIEMRDEINRFLRQPVDAAGTTLDDARNGLTLLEQRYQQRLSEARSGRAAPRTA